MTNPRLARSSIALASMLGFLFLSACSDSTPGEGSATGEGRDTGIGGGGGIGEGRMGSGELGPLTNDRLAREPILFDTDGWTVRADMRPRVESLARAIAASPTGSFTVEGHADERGTREYNLALGARRANSVKAMLVSLGVAPNRLQPVSYGKERPAVVGHSQAAWAENRRVVLANN
jgi:peptidoglycan-associated lipoprotein